MGMIHIVHKCNSSLLYPDYENSISSMAASIFA